MTFKRWDEPYEVGDWVGVQSVRQPLEIVAIKDGYATLRLGVFVGDGKWISDPDTEQDYPLTELGRAYVIVDGPAA